MAVYRRRLVPLRVFPTEVVFMLYIVSTYLPGRLYNRYTRENSPSSTLSGSVTEIKTCVFVADFQNLFFSNPMYTMQAMNMQVSFSNSHDSPSSVRRLQNKNTRK